MNADWLFDPAGVAGELGRVARRAEDALDDARAALERTEADAASERDHRALAEALVGIAEARHRMHELDEELLGDAERLLRQVLKQLKRPDLNLVREA